jgi:predicted anti-sigma-YlaC factor YlaD
MDGWTAFGSCDRAREAISRVLDDELSPFEARLLADHLDDCSDCREFHAGAAATTASLRAAPLLPLEQPLTLPRRRVARPLQGSAAAVVAAAAVLVLSVAGPVDLNSISGVPTVDASRAQASSARRIVPDGIPFPADFPQSQQANPQSDPVAE